MLDIRAPEFKKTTFKVELIKSQLRKLSLLVPEEDKDINEIKKLLLMLFDKKRDVKGRLYNNNTNSNQEMTIEQFINIFINSQYILSGYNVLFESHEDAVNIGAMAVANLLTERGFNKNKMMEAEYGSDEYIYYHIIQATFKILANSYYGVQGQSASFFYDPFVQNSITLTAQDLTTTSIVALEAFMENNLYYIDTDAVLDFIVNTLDSKREYKILEFVEPVSASQLFTRMKPLFQENVNQKLIQEVFGRLNEEELTILYYKNNIKELVKIDHFKNKISELIKTEGEDDYDENLKLFISQVVEFTHYGFLYDERFKMGMLHPRKAVVAYDTDSNFINLDNLLELVSETANIGNDEESQLKLTNLLIHIITDILADTFNKVTASMGIKPQHRHHIEMKSEFLYKILLLTKNKKQYAGIITAELGKRLNKPQIDIKGLSIKKSTVPKTLRDEFVTILEEDILKADKIDLRKITDKYDELSDSVYNSLKRGEIHYATPKSVSSPTQYVNPDRMEALRAALIWNALEPADEIQLPDKINMIKLKKLDIDSPQMKELQAKHPDKYNAIMKVVYNEGVTKPTIDISRFGFSVIGLPQTVTEIPEYILPFIDYDAMVNQNIRNGYILLESLGIQCHKVNNEEQYKSNIIAL